MFESLSEKLQAVFERIGRKGRLGGFSRDQKQQVMRTLEAVEMAKLADEPIGGLSGGQSRIQ